MIPQVRTALYTSLLLASSASLSSQTAPFAPSFEIGYMPYTLGSQNLSPVQGDFNHDGKPDFIIAGATSTNTYPLNLLLGNGDGTFQNPVAVSTANSAILDIAVADFNNDGNLDVLTIDAANNFSVFLGNGNGTFRAPIITPTAAPPVTGTLGNFFNNGYIGVALADTNGDIEVFRNVGGTSFVLASTVQAVIPPASSSNSSYFLRLRAGNINGTAVSDLAVLTNTSAYALWNNGQGIFSKALLGNYPYPFDLTVGSVNQSPSQDVIISYACNVSTIQAGHVDPYNCAGLDVFYGQGNNKTFFRTAVNTNNLVPATSVYAIDVNGDGIADLVASDQQPNGTVLGLYTWLGHPDGSFDQAPTLFNSGSNGPIVPGDFTRDGMMDFAQISIANGNLATYLNGGQHAPCLTSSISPTVTVCQPVNNTYFPAGYIDILANAYDKNKVTAFQLYIDGTLDYSEAVTSFSVNTPLNPGPHSLVSKAWDYTGLSFRSDRNIISYTGTPGPTCPATLGTANMCLPASTTSSSTSVHIVANGSTAAVPTAAQLYIDGKLVINNQGYCYSNGNCAGGVTYVDTTQTLAPGSHNLVFKLYDANGGVSTAQKTITVQ